MKSAIVLLVCLFGYSASSPINSLGLAGLIPIHDDGQWRPHSDGSVLGSGQIQWLGADLDDGQWKPHLDGSLAGIGISGHHLWKRSLWGVNPNSLPVPADTLHVALAKNAQLIQQNTEGTRNILGGGIPLALPADTHEVAIGKQAHAIAHARQTAITHGHGIGIGSVAAVAPVSHLGLAGVGVNGLGLGLGGVGLRGVGLAGVGLGGVGLAGIGGLGVHGLGVHGLGVHGAHGLW